jgi:RNA polymerase sigma factor (sigma-70 family)
MTDEQDVSVEGNVPLVKYIIRKSNITPPKGMDYDDLVAFGIEGLAKASRDYDDSMGAKFSTYAWIRIKGEILDAIARWTHSRRTDQVAVGSLDNTDGEWDPPSGALSVEEQVLNRELTRKLIGSMGKLPDRYRDLVQAHYVEDRDLTEIANDWGISRSRIYKIHAEVLRRLRRLIVED